MTDVLCPPCAQAAEGTVNAKNSEPPQHAAAQRSRLPTAKRSSAPFPTIAPRLPLPHTRSVAPEGYPPCCRSTINSAAQKSWGGTGSPLVQEENASAGRKHDGRSLATPPLRSHRP